MPLFKLFFALLVLFNCVSARAAGWVDGAHIVDSDFRVWGWGCDRSVPNEQVWLHIWRDDNVFLGAAHANIYRESAVGAACGGSSQHGFYAKLVVNPSLLDWKTHSVYVYVIGPSGSERLSPTPSISFKGIDNSRKPKNPGDVVGRDYFGKYAGHLGLWDGNKVVQMTGEKVGGGLPTMSIETIDSFNSHSRPWDAVTPRFPPNLSVKKCYLPSCSHNNDRSNLNAAVAVAARARQIFLIGADYTAIGGYVPAREGSGVRGDTWPPIRGMYRCDSFVQNSYGVLLAGQYREDLWLREVFNAPNDWNTRIFNILNKSLPTTVYEAIKSTLP